MPVCINMIVFIKCQQNNYHARDDYKELLNLSLGGTTEYIQICTQ